MNKSHERMQTPTNLKVVRGGGGVVCDIEKPVQFSWQNEGGGGGKGKSFYLGSGAGTRAHSLDLSWTTLNVLWKRGLLSSRTCLFISKFFVILPVASISTVLNGIFCNPIGFINLSLSRHTRQRHLLFQINLEVLRHVRCPRAPWPAHWPWGSIVQTAVRRSVTLVHATFEGWGCDLAVCDRAIFHS